MDNETIRKIGRLTDTINTEIQNRKVIKKIIMDSVVDIRAILLENMEQEPKKTKTIGDKVAERVAEVKKNYEFLSTHEHPEIRNKAEAMSQYDILVESTILSMVSDEIKKWFSERKTTTEPKTNTEDREQTENKKQMSFSVADLTTIQMLIENGIKRITKEGKPVMVESEGVIEYWNELSMRFNIA